jgi:hypothetical protein
VHPVQYMPGRHFATGKNDPAFRAKPQIGADLAIRARGAGFAFRALCAHSAYRRPGQGFRGELAETGLPTARMRTPGRRGRRAGLVCTSPAHGGPQHKAVR